MTGWWSYGMEHIRIQNFNSVILLRCSHVILYILDLTIRYDKNVMLSDIFKWNNRIFKLPTIKKCFLQSYFIFASFECVGVDFLGCCFIFLLLVILAFFVMDTFMFCIQITQTWNIHITKKSWGITHKITRMIFIRNRHTFLLKQRKQFLNGQKTFENDL